MYYAPVPLSQIYSRTSTNEPFELIRACIRGHSSPFLYIRGVLLMRVGSAGEYESFEHVYVCWERVVIVFVSQRTCCILAILTVFVLHSGCSYCILGHSYMWDWGWYEWTRTQYEWRWNVPETAAKYLFVFIFMLIRLCLTPGMLIRTYSYYFLTQLGSFLFVRVKY